MNPLATFGMLSPEEVLQACPNPGNPISADDVQQNLNCFNLMLVKLLTRYNLSDKLRQDLLNLGEHYLLVSPEVKFSFDKRTFNIIRSLGFDFRSNTSSSYDYYGYVEILPADEKPGHDANQFLAFTGSAVKDQLNYLLKEQPDPKKDALDFCLFHVLHTIFYMHNFHMLDSVNIFFFPNMLEPAFPELKLLGWNVRVDYKERVTSLIFPDEILQVYRKEIFD